MREKTNWSLGVKVLILMLMGSQSLWALSHKEEIAKAQAWVNSFNKPYPILIFNRLELRYLLDNHDALGDTKENEQKRIKVIQDYVKEKLGFDISREDVLKIDHNLLVGIDSAVAQPITQTEGYSLKTTKVCFAFPRVPNFFTQSENERILGMNDPKVSFPGDYDDLNVKESFEVLYLFSLYHEAAHCLDEVYLSQADSYQPSPTDVHMGEAFAELMAYMKVSQIVGSREIGKTRALYRAIYSRIVGEYLPTQPTFGTGCYHTEEQYIIYLRI